MGQRRDRVQQAGPEVKRLICRFRGHVPVQVRRLGVLPTPAGMLPLLDGVVAYIVDPEGDHTACVRCRDVLR